jgi:hypothetical protein
MTPLIQAPSVIPQIIPQIITMSIATCNKLFENMTLFNGDHKDTKITGTVNGKNFYWKINTGSVVTCMNINAFMTAFSKTKERYLKDFKMDIFIKKRKCTHTVQIADELSENILGIDFLQKFRLHLDPKTKEITFQSAPSKALLICHQKFHDASFCHNSGTGQNVPNPKQTTPLHRKHRSAKTTFDIRTLNSSQFRPPKSMYSANPELCYT